MSYSETKANWKFKNIKETFRSKLLMLGASLMFPLSLLAFASLLLGFTFIFPSDWAITKILSGTTYEVIVIFIYLVYYSIINTFHKNKNYYTFINATLFLLSILTIQHIIKLFNLLDDSYLSNSLFTMMICSSFFVYVDYKYDVKLYWVLIALIISIVLIPIFILITFIVNGIGKLIGSIPWGINAFLYGFINRLLLPFGLHTIMIPTFTYSAVGGTLNIYEGTMLIDSIQGDSAIWSYMYTHGINFSLNKGTYIYEQITYNFELIGNNVPGQYQEGFLPVTGFIFPIMGLSYVLVHGWEKGKHIFLGSLFTMVSGITEMTEFTFVLLNPFLYFLNALIVGLSFMLCNLFNVSVWLSTGWIFDIILFGIIPSIKGFTTHWYIIPLIGIGLGVVYGLLFNIIDKYSKYELKGIINKE